MSNLPRLIVDSTERNSDLRYACAFHTTGDRVVFLLKRGRPWLVVPSMELESARTALAPPGGAVFSPAELELDPADRRSAGAWAYGLLRRAGVSRVAVGADFPVAVADELRRRKIGVDVVDGPLFSERSVKHGRELDYCRASQRAAVRGMRAAAAMIGTAVMDAGGRLRHDGRVLTSERVRQRIEAELFAHGCAGTGTIVSCGADSALPHHRGHGPLWSGRSIVIDIFPRHRQHGYYGDLTRTLVRGPVPAELRRMLNAVMAARRAALAQVRPGVSAASVHRAAAGEFERRGMITQLRAVPPRGFIHGTGHGVGLDVHEPPWLGRSRERLRVGQVLTVEPGWYEPGFGGVRIEDTVVVTARGHQLLARCSLRSRLQ